MLEKLRSRHPAWTEVSLWAGCASDLGSLKKVSVSLLFPHQSRNLSAMFAPRNGTNIRPNAVSLPRNAILSMNAVPKTGSGKRRHSSRSDRQSLPEWHLTVCRCSISPGISCCSSSRAKKRKRRKTGQGTPQPAPLQALACPKESQTWPALALTQPHHAGYADQGISFPSAMQAEKPVIRLSGNGTGKIRRYAHGTVSAGFGYSPVSSLCGIYNGCR